MKKNLVCLAICCSIATAYTAEQDRNPRKRGRSNSLYNMGVVFHYAERQRQRRALEVPQQLRRQGAIAVPAVPVAAVAVVAAAAVAEPADDATQDTVTLDSQSSVPSGSFATATAIS